MGGGGSGACFCFSVNAVLYQSSQIVLLMGCSLFLLIFDCLLPKKVGTEEVEGAAEEEVGDGVTEEGTMVPVTIKDEETTTGGIMVVALLAGDHQDKGITGRLVVEGHRITGGLEIGKDNTVVNKVNTVVVKHKVVTVVGRDITAGRHKDDKVEGQDNTAVHKTSTVVGKDNTVVHKAHLATVEEEARLLMGGGEDISRGMTAVAAVPPINEEGEVVTKVGEEVEVVGEDAMDVEGAEDVDEAPIFLD